VKPADISRIKRGTIGKTKLKSFQRTMSTRTSETCREEKMNLKGFKKNLGITS
jgi:hypothetical protein